MSATNPPSDAITTWGPGPASTAPPATIAEGSSAEAGPHEPRLVRRFRLDPIGASPQRAALRAALIWAALGAGFVLIGGGNLDPGADDARLGLAAGEGIGPLGQVYGGWDPALWPLPVLASQAWAWGEGGTPTTASIRWPAAIAGLLLGLILSLRTRHELGRRAGLLTALCVFGTVALMHRTAGAGLDLFQGLCVVGALDRILARRADWAAGAWAAAAVLAGGWPPLAMILLPIVVLGGPGRAFSHRLLLPPVAAFVAWSAWTLSVASTELWAAALTLPLTKPMAAWLVPSVLLLGQPWAPLAALAAFPSVRSGWTPQGRALVVGWLQLVAVALLAGTLIPGMATPARMVALAGLAVAAAAAFDRVWSAPLGNAPRRVFLGIGLAVVLAWASIAVGLGGYLAVAVSYYRPLGAVLAVAGYVLAVAAVCGAIQGRPRWVLGSLVAVAVCLKVAHWGIYVPEWNYRVGQGPWGRAIGQWVLPNRPIYTFTPWPHHLMFHTGRPVRLLPSERALNHRDLSTPQYVLLHEAEYDHWPSSAPPIVKVRALHDERGRVRVLARTAGDLNIRPHAPSWDNPADPPSTPADSAPLPPGPPPLPDGASQ